MTVELTPSKIRWALRYEATRVDGTLWKVVVDEDVYVSVRWDPATDVYDCSCGDVVDSIPGPGGRTPGCLHVAAVVLAHRRERARLRAVSNRRLEWEAEVAMREAPLPSPSEPRFQPPGEPAFPDWVQGFRRPQWDAIEAVMACFDDGAKAVMLQAPTGSGKTLVGETVRRLIGGGQPSRGLYVCSTKTLQDQAARDFPYAKVLKGRGNYPTLSGGGVTVDAWGRAEASPGAGAGAGTGRSEVTAADCTAVGGGKGCRWCDPTAKCPYRIARDEARRARFTILNTSYFLVDANKGGGKFAGRDLAVVDEADLLEGELLNQVEIHISKARMRRLAMASPDRKTADFSHGGVRTNDPARAWLPWVQEEAIPRVQRRLDRLPPPESGTLGEIRERRGLVELLERLEDLAAELPNGGWVYDGRDGDIIFRPVEVGRWGKRLLWPHAKRFLLMSGSIISADEMASSLGVDGGYRLVDVPMSFPAANRPINAVGVVEVTNKNQRRSWPVIAKGLAGVLAMHPDDRVLVHTVSYPLAMFLAREVRPMAPGRTIVTYDGAKGRDEALGRYKATPGAVLLAPSMDRGIDLPDDLCRVQVIAKVPFPNLGDKRTEARLYRTPGGKAWYAVNTVRALVQMTGRGVRSDTDHATTYVLDHTFTTNVWLRHRSLLPLWWREAVNTRYPAHRVLRAAEAVSTSGQHTA